MPNWKLRKKQSNKIIQNLSNNIFYLLLAIFISFSIQCNKDSSIYNLLNEHLNKYPEMTVQDIYKLLYQSTFGVKHLLTDTLKARDYLLKEYNEINASDEPLLENISIDNEVVRVNLRSFKNKKLNIDKLFEVMLISAEEIKGETNEFKKCWQAFESLVKSNEFNFKIDTVVSYYDLIATIPKEVHHSKEFIELYKPHYRVVIKNVFLKYFPEAK
jgi:hypothetical protein